MKTTDIIDEFTKSNGAFEGANSTVVAKEGTLWHKIKDGRTVTGASPLVYAPQGKPYWVQLTEYSPFSSYDLSVDWRHLRRTLQEPSSGRPVSIQIHENALARLLDFGIREAARVLGDPMPPHTDEIAGVEPTPLILGAFTDIEFGAKVARDPFKWTAYHMAQHRSLSFTIGSLTHKNRFSPPENWGEGFFGTLFRSIHPDYLSRMFDGGWQEFVEDFATQTVAAQNGVSHPAMAIHQSLAKLTEATEKSRGLWRRGAEKSFSFSSEEDMELFEALKADAKTIRVLAGALVGDAETMEMAVKEALPVRDHLSSSSALRYRCPDNTPEGFPMTLPSPIDVTLRSLKQEVVLPEEGEEGEPETVSTFAQFSFPELPEVQETFNGLLESVFGRPDILKTPELAQETPSGEPWPLEAIAALAEAKSLQQIA